MHSSDSTSFVNNEPEPKGIITESWAVRYYLAVLASAWGLKTERQMLMLIPMLLLVCRFTRLVL